MSVADSDRIAELKGRMAVLLGQRREAHDARDRQKEAALPPRVPRWSSGLLTARAISPKLIWADRKSVV